MSTAPLPRRVRKISYSAARRMTLVTGLVILVGLAAVLYFTRVDTIEVVAVLFYLPVFVAFMTWGVPGGLVAGAAAAGAYVALRYPSLNAIRGRDLLSLLLGRALGYVAFGAIGGWASRVLQGSILKLNLYDTVDDDTGLLNARQFAIEGHRQIERGQRYGTTFSLTSVQVDDAALIRGTGRRGRANLRELGRSVKATVRQVDAAGHSSDGAVHRLAVLLPDTGQEGAAVFAGRMAASLQRHLVREGPEPGAPSVQSLTFPADLEVIQSVLALFEEDDVRENGARQDPTL